MKQERCPWHQQPVLALAGGLQARWKVYSPPMVWVWIGSPTCSDVRLLAPELCSPLHFLCEEHLVLYITWHWPHLPSEFTTPFRQSKTIPLVIKRDKHWKMKCGISIEAMDCVLVVWKLLPARSVSVSDKVKSQTQLFTMFLVGSGGMGPGAPGRPGDTLTN